MKNKKKIIFAVVTVVVIVVILAIFFAINSDEDNDSYRSIAVEKTAGDILVLRDNEDEIDAYEGMKLKNGDNVNVLEESNMALKADDKYLFADENTNFTLDADESGKKIIINLEEGSVLVRIENALKDDEVYEVHTPNSVMAVRGTVFSIGTSFDENGELKTKLLVFDGTVESACLTSDGEKMEPLAVSAGLKLVVKGKDDTVEYEEDPVTGEVLGEITKEDISKVIADELLDFMADGEDIALSEDVIEEIAESEVVEPESSSTSEVASTEAPTTEAPTTEAPTTEAPTTEAPTTEAPTTEAPTTEAPTTEVPTTEVPTTEAPTTEAPTTEAPTTEATTTEAPTTEAPTTEAPTTEAPTTEAPTTEAPTTETPTTEAPTTEKLSEKPEQDKPNRPEQDKQDRPGHGKHDRQDEDKDKDRPIQEATTEEETTLSGDLMKAAMEDMIIGSYEGESKEGIPVSAEVSRDRDGSLSLSVNVAGIWRTVSGLDFEVNEDGYGISFRQELVPGTGIYEMLSISFDENILEDGVESAQVEYSTGGIIPMSYSVSVTKKQEP